MKHPGSSAERRHLRLVGTPDEGLPPVGKALLVVRAAVSAVALLFLTVVARVSAVVALAPLVWRRAPVGRRARPPRARVIPFEPARRALPR